MADLNAGPPLGARWLALIAASIAVGLYMDVAADLPGQIGASVLAWGLLLYLLRSRLQQERGMLFSCLVIATAGELFLSLVWGLYRYRLDNIPLFVPPDHALLLILGLALAKALSERAALAVIGLAGAYTLGAALLEVDTFGLLLYALLVGCALWQPRRRRLFASTFVLALALELYGTWLGNWAWSSEVPWLGLVTTNPPLAAGAFYCALDMLVMIAAPVLRDAGVPVERATRTASG